MAKDPIPKADVPATALPWEHAVKDIPETGLKRRRAAEPEELAAIARALDLSSCNGLEGEYTVMPTGEGRHQVYGTLRAEVVQACVVTLEPVAGTIEERFEVSFWPAEEIPKPASGVVDPGEELDPEPIVGGQIAVGRIVYECLATAIDPFPRAPGAALDRTSTAPDGGGSAKPESPFAVLAKIRAKD